MPINTNFFVWLCWVFTAACELSLVVVSGAYSLVARRRPVEVASRRGGVPSRRRPVEAASLGTELRL